MAFHLKLEGGGGQISTVWPIVFLKNGHFLPQLLAMCCTVCCGWGWWTSSPHEHTKKKKTDLFPNRDDASNATSKHLCGRALNLTPFCQPY